MPARNVAAFVAAIDWTPVVVALITMVGSIVTTAISAWIVYQLRTPLGKRLGQVVTETHEQVVNGRDVLDTLAAEAERE